MEVRKILTSLTLIKPKEVRFKCLWLLPIGLINKRMERPKA
ncbi:MAG: hypothetical protein ACTS6G_00470 [Candidatus Hodgkinia cicadicola]